MKITPEIFKAYDIRGIYPTEVNPKVAYLIGRAFAKLLKEKYRTDKLNIVCGRDVRLSSKELTKSLMEGLIEEEAEVFDIGVASTDVIYFATGFYKRDGGVMVTASHNPKEYNGFKFCGKNAEGISGKNGVYRMRDIVIEGSEFQTTGSRRGRVILSKDVIGDYIDAVLSFVDITQMKPIHLAVDAGNGVGGEIFRSIFSELASRLPIEWIELYFEPNGNFPNHHPDPSKLENIKELQEVVVREKCDLGIAFDGDADRAVFVTGNGEPLDGTLVGSLMVQKILKDAQGAKIIYSINCGRVLEEVIEKNCGKGIIAPVGHSNIKKLMRENNAILGIEHSGHYYFRKHYYADSAMVASLIILEIVSENGPLDQLIEPLKKYFSSGEINLEVSDKGEKIKVVKDRYRNGKVLEIDGIRVDYPDWWFLLRPSNTEPLLRFTIEANSQELLSQKKKEILETISDKP